MYARSLIGSRGDGRRWPDGEGSDPQGRGPGSPLDGYSTYIAARVQSLRTLADELTADLDLCFTGEPQSREDAKGRVAKTFWLWVFGAYEVARTMCESRGCFSKRLERELSELKRLLEPIRVADAKMEGLRFDRKARPLPLDAHRATERWDEAARDLFLGDPARATWAGSYSHTSRPPWSR